MSPEIRIQNYINYSPLVKLFLTLISFFVERMCNLLKITKHKNINIQSKLTRGAWVLTLPKTMRIICIVKQKYIIQFKLRLSCECFLA